VAEPAPPWRGGWRLVGRRGPPEVLVVPPDPCGRRLACLVHPTTASVVLGSAQQEADFDAGLCAAEGLSLVRRPSGGGAVLIVPGAQVWLDLFLPVADPLYDPDVVRASSWVGALWRRALAACGISGTLVVHEGNLRKTAWSRRICFSGVGPGEVTRHGAKLTGVSQRRDRSGAWFFTMALIGPEQRQLAPLLAAGRAERAALGRALAAETAVVGRPAVEVEQALAAELGGAFLAGEDVPAEPHPRQGDDEAGAGKAEQTADRLARPWQPARERGNDLERRDERQEGDPDGDGHGPVAHRRTR
jgi:lipoate-protein ligase A